MSAGNDWTDGKHIVRDAADGVRTALTALGVRDENIRVEDLADYHRQNAPLGAVRLVVSDHDEQMPGVSYTVIVL